MNLLRTLHVRRRWDQGTSASPKICYECRRTHYNMLPLHYSRPAAGAPPDRISTYNRSRAGSMLHRYGNVSSTKPLRKRNSRPSPRNLRQAYCETSTLPTHGKSNHLRRIETLDTCLIKACLHVTTIGWVSNK